MMLPGITISPPNFFTPRRLPRLSRPLREEPPAFLCAICCSLFALRTVAAPDLVNAQDGQVLAMTLLATIVVPPFLLENDDLGRPRLLDDRGVDSRATEQRRAGRNVSALADHQHLSEFDSRTGLRRELLDRDDVVLGDLVLLPAGADHCEHDSRRYSLPLSGRNRPSARKRRIARRRGGGTIGDR